MLLLRKFKEGVVLRRVKFGQLAVVIVLCDLSFGSRQRISYPCLEINRRNFTSQV